ncbi:MAG TPA: hypothetical protein VNE82_03485 [Candidatus Binataceae bacterium]|nr:hypothetical protein [Candidatus Binataceae bacterium]
MTTTLLGGPATPRQLFGALDRAIDNASRARRAWDGGHPDAALDLLRCAASTLDTVREQLAKRWRSAVASGG